MISEVPSHHQTTQISDPSSVCEKDPNLTVTETVNGLAVNDNIFEIRRDTEYNLTQFYPLELFYERKESFDKKMAEQKEKWQKEREELTASKNGIRRAELPEETHEIATFFPR